MKIQEARRVAVIGAGPRGTSVVERLVAGHASHGDGAPALSIHVVDPYHPGPGRIWRADQSRLFLMNTPCFYPTVVPVGAASRTISSSPVGLDFDAWRQRAGAGLIEGLDDADVAESGRLSPADFPSRVLYGRYLAWVFADVVRKAPPNVTVLHHRAEAIDLEKGADDGGWRVTLAHRTVDGAPSGADPDAPRGSRPDVAPSSVEILDVDDVVLALGHVDATLSAGQAALQDAGARHGLGYWPPAVPADVDWQRLPAGEAVLVRGLGLNFFDAMIQLTEGRGGRFEVRAGGKLEYVPSGQEPRLVAASRRGVPYRAKAALSSYIPRGVQLRFCTLDRALSFSRDGVQPGFDHDLWPLLHRDVLWAYYSTLCRTRGPGIEDPERFLGELDAALSAEGASWEPLAEEVVTRAVPAAVRLDVEGLAHPFAGRGFENGGMYDQAVLAYLDADALGSSRGEGDPLKMAIGAMNAGRSVIKQAVADGGISDASWAMELRGWFEPLVEGLASGPPLRRIEQLAALIRADVVTVMGPDPVFGFDPEEGLFEASSPWVQGGTFRARHLVEAMMPTNRVAASRSPLVRALIGRGTVRARTGLPENGVPVPSAGLDVTPPPYRAVDHAGHGQSSLYVIGLHLSSTQWGTAIAAESGADLRAGARTLLDADVIAHAILEPDRSRVLKPGLRSLHARDN